MKKPMNSTVIKAAAVALGIAVSVSASAQMKMYQNGHVAVGKAPVTTTTAGNTVVGSGTVTPIIGGGTISSVDTTATLSVLGKGLYASSGKIAFGTSGNVWLGESAWSNTSISPSSLQMQGKGGFHLMCGNKDILFYSPSVMTIDGGSTLIAGVAMQAPQYLTTSDARLKKNISSLENIGDIVESLTPVSYQYQDSTSTGMKKTKGITGDKHLIYGFLAQEVREILPDLVYEDSEGLLSIDYQGFIPVLVDAVKGLRTEAAEMRQTIEEQQKKIERLENGGRNLSQGTGENQATLSQNRPNPFRTETEIKCHLPENVSDAFICIYDLNGNQKRRIVLTDRGDVSVTVSANSLNAGLYLYSLIADGVEIDSKRMILTD
ncbi:MAG: tail fiber domain-containing protein [Muribaculaceae bacterium]|nr:tail fiber domain-containing protein [Muribaculaceae bacterium]